VEAETSTGRPEESILYASRVLKGGLEGESMTRQSFPFPREMSTMMQRTVESSSAATVERRGWRCSPPSTTEATEACGRVHWETRAGKCVASAPLVSHLSIQKDVDLPFTTVDLVMAR
jgi:hypothetical protein